MQFTKEQEAIITHPVDAHALVRAVPGSGKTTTLVARVASLCERGVDPKRIRVVMFNRSIEKFFRVRLEALGVRGVRVNTFDSLGLEVLREANRRGLLKRKLVVVADGKEQWAREIYHRHRAQIEDEDDLADAVAFWKAHLVSPKHAVFSANPTLAKAYAEFEELRLADGFLRVAFADMVYTAVGVLKEHPRLLYPIDHLFVDEFQDVNLGRVTLLQRLSHEQTSVMAVGDEDQAINEWCGARPQFFSDFSTYFPWLPSLSYPLPHSFRFGPSLGAAATRLIGHNEGRGHIEVIGAGETESAIIENRDVLATIAALSEEGIPRGEIAVLYRGRGQGLGLIAHMANERIAMETEDFERLRKGRAAKLALGYLHFATSDVGPSMKDAWRIVHAPDRFIGKARFEQQLRQRGVLGLAATLADRALAREVGQSTSAVATMSELAETLRLMGRCTTAGEALDVLCERVNIEDQLTAMIQSKRKRELTIATFTAFRSFVDGLDVSPADAVSAVETFDPTCGELPEQRLWASTIHKAKGKEWRCVILPALAEGLCPAEMVGEIPGTTSEPDGVEQSPWMEQERRIFYVGLTRASERVYVQALPPTPSRFLTEMRPPPPPRQQKSRTAPALRPANPANPANRPSAHGKPWSDVEQLKVIEAWESGADVTAIAARLGRSASAIAHCVVRMGLAADVDEANDRGSVR
jgi:DNA helicase II / ATP-dependent DNA helicase PcrA